MAIQPLDAKIHLGGLSIVKNYPFILGNSVAGIVAALGSHVTRFGIGDRVVADTAAYTDQDLRMGAWQKFVIAPQHTVAKIGDVNLSEAVTLSFPLQTGVAALHLYLGMGKPGAGNPCDKVLIWGAGGAVGSCAVQYAKLVGHTIIVTASPKDTHRQKAMGASQVVDYHKPNAVEELRKLGPFRYLFRASGDRESQQALASLLQPLGGTFASVSGGDVELPSNVRRIYAPFAQAPHSKENDAYASWIFGHFFPSVIGEGVIQPTNYTLRNGGLRALQQASEDVYDGSAREKIVINPNEQEDR